MVPSSAMKNCSWRRPGGPRPARRRFLVVSVLNEVHVAIKMEAKWFGAHAAHRRDRGENPALHPREPSSSGRRDEAIQRPVVSRRSRPIPVKPSSASLVRSAGRRRAAPCPLPVVRPPRAISRAACAHDQDRKAPVAQRGNQCRRCPALDHRTSPPDRTERRSRAGPRHPSRSSDADGSSPCCLHLGRQIPVVGDLAQALVRDSPRVERCSFCRCGRLVVQDDREQRVIDLEATL